jgi:hypothetical protein
LEPDAFPPDLPPVILSEFWDLKIEGVVDKWSETVNESLIV